MRAPPGAGAGGQPLPPQALSARGLCGDSQSSHGLQVLLSRLGHQRYNSVLDWSDLDLNIMLWLCQLPYALKNQFEHPKTQEVIQSTLRCDNVMLRFIDPRIASSTFEIRISQQIGKFYTMLPLLAP